MKTILVLLPVLALASGQYFLPYNFGITPYSLHHTGLLAPPVTRLVSSPLVSSPLVSVPLVKSTQYHAQDELGQFTFGHSSENLARTEMKSLDGRVTGAYSYVDPTGKLIKVDYLADSNGFRVLGANNLPIAPVDTAVPVKETEEVMKAREEFIRKFEEAKKEALKTPEELKVRRRRDIGYLPYSIGFDTIDHRFESIPLTIKSSELKPIFEERKVEVPVIKSVIKTIEFKPIEDVKTPAATKLAEFKEREDVRINPLFTPISYSLPLHTSFYPHHTPLFFK